MRKLFQVFAEFPDHGQIFRIRFTRRIFQSPVRIESSADIRAPDAAAHGDGNVRSRDIPDGPGVLAAHVDAKLLLHDPDGILIDSFRRI